MPAHAHARATAGGSGGRPAPVPGSGPGLGSGSGSLPGLVLFESGLTGMGCKHTRTRPAPLRIQTARQRLSENRLCGWAVGRLRRLNRTVATIQTEPLQLLMGSDLSAPPGAL